MSDWYADGSGWNGKECAWAVVRPDGTHLKYVETIFPYTNNQCEYKAVILAIAQCNPGDTIYTDSQLVVKQASGEYRCKVKHLDEPLQLVRSLIKEKNITLKWISRKNNLAGKLFE